MTFNTMKFNLSPFNVPPSPELMARVTATRERLAEMPDSYMLPESAAPLLDVLYGCLADRIDMPRPEKTRWSKPMGEKLFDAALEIGKAILIALATAIFERILFH